MKKILQKEILYGAKNYSPINVCIKKAKGVYLTDIENNKYLDFISPLLVCKVNPSSVFDTEDTLVLL